MVVLTADEVLPVDIPVVVLAVASAAAVVLVVAVVHDLVLLNVPTSIHLATLIK